MAKRIITARGSKKKERVTFFLAYGVIQSSPEKLEQYDSWCRRLEDVRKADIERVELLSFTGTINFARFGLIHPRAHLGPLYRAGAANFRSSDQQRIPLLPSFRRHIRSIRQEFALTGGSATLDVNAPAESWEPIMWADSCRNPTRLDVWSGMGGFCADTCIWWFYRFSEEEILELPIHVTEMWASNVNLAVNGIEMRSTSFGDATDSDASHHVIRAHGAQDPRLHDLILMRHASCLQYDIDPHNKWISTDDNVLADPISHGDFGTFKSRATALGYDHLRCVDIRNSNLLNDMAVVSAHLIAQTRRMCDPSGRDPAFDL